MDKNSQVILIVEDGKSQAEMVRKIFAFHFKLEIQIAHSGVEALAKFDEYGERIVVVTLDIAIPQIDGIELVQILVNRHRYIVGFIPLTGRDWMLPELDVHFKNSEFCIRFEPHIKPHKFEKLIQNVENAIESVNRKRKHHSNHAILDIKNYVSCIKEISENNVLTSDKIISKTEDIISRINMIDEKIIGIESKIQSIADKIKSDSSLTNDIGREVLKVIVIGLFVIFLLGVGIEDLILKCLDIFRK